MTDREPYFAGIAALMGDPARANILAALMDGRAMTAKELALIAGVSPPTTSGHLGKLVDGKLLEVIVQGRYRYYRLADSLVACAIEGIMALSSADPARRRRPASPASEALRAARTCYDHLAGRLGVSLMDRLLGEGHIQPSDADFRVTKRGAAFFQGLGIDVAAVARQRRGFARPCLDWSERRPHLAGALGAALTGQCFEHGWIERFREGRAVAITSAGRDALRDKFGIDVVPQDAAR
ncbi:MAG: helix-turn-helix transcriptional regulator [Alphaproteobacteria bacterium]|nr:helix-turn-helix transcriptional regulator [Alphaproteobacteria bacterium]